VNDIGVVDKYSTLGEYWKLLIVGAVPPVLPPPPPQCVNKRRQPAMTGRRKRLERWRPGFGRTNCPAGELVMFFIVSSVEG
jgi:hypothetical protein